MYTHGVLYCIIAYIEYIAEDNRSSVRQVQVSALPRASRVEHGLIGVRRQKVSLRRLGGGLIPPADSQPHPRPTPPQVVGRGRSSNGLGDLHSTVPPSDTTASGGSREV